MISYKYDKASLIQRAWREFNERNEKNKNQRLKSLLQRFIERILYYSDATLTITLHQWNKNAHMIKYKMVLPYKIFVWI